MTLRDSQSMLEGEEAGTLPIFAATANALDLPFKLADVKSHLGLNPEPVIGLVTK